MDLNFLITCIFLEIKYEINLMIGKNKLDNFLVK
jgi:hypothetical protein